MGRLLQCLREERNPAGGLATRDRQPAVHAPQIGKTSGIESLLATFGWMTESFRCLSDIVLKQPRLGEGTSNLGLLVAMKTRLPQGPYEERSGFDTGPLFKRSRRLPIEIGRCHGAQYSRYTGGVDTSASATSQFAVRD